MSASFARPIAVIAGLAPSAMSERVALSPSHAARLAALSARTGVSREQIIADLLEDHLFSLPELSGVAS